MPWFHLTPLPNDPSNADYELPKHPHGGYDIGTGDFDGDGKDELGIRHSNESSKSAHCDEIWIMKFNSSEKTWQHLSPIDSELLTDLDATNSAISINNFVAADINGDGKDEITFIPHRERDKPPRNIIWVMGYNNSTN